jgi:hypothetical protein
VICAYTLQRLRGGMKRGALPKRSSNKRSRKLHEHRALWITDGEQEDT